LVFGSVAASGRVILATRGLKAERMRIEALVTDDEALGERYGVPIYPTREALLADFPPHDYSGLVDVDESEPTPSGQGVRVTFTASYQETLRKAFSDAAQAARKAAEYGVKNLGRSV